MIGELKNPQNPIPSSLPSLKGKDYKILNLYIKEWEVIINTQMHFNDLLLRFRSITLTAFVTLIGITIAIQEVISLTNQDIILILIIIATLWITAFILDFGYYNRLLLGSVAQALKFDKSETFKQYGLFGMTSCINEHIQPPTSRVLLIFYYLFPLVVVAILLFFRFK